MSIDTACSSSLVALHSACMHLRMRECRMALAGGVTVILSPEIGIAFSKAHMMASDGRCKAFDARADGFVRGEGCGVVVLKRLSDALTDGDHILAVIRGSAVNQDGRSSGMTAPNGAAQKAVIRTALAQAGVRPEEVGYVEAHGTGTSLGDPIEAHALAHVLGSGRDKENPLVIGSVKTNVGHLEAAAGIAGLIKAVLVLQHEQIPAHLHFQQMNPHIDWGGVPVEIPLRARPWPRGNRRRVAGVSSFGFSGTNAHVILEEAPEPPIRPPASERPLHLLALSARSESALRALGGRYVQVLENCPFPVGDLCFTANAGRPHFEHRLAVTGSSFGQLRDALLKALPGRRVLDREGIRPVFLFPGQGAQYAGMGKQLFDTQPVFRAAIDECAALLREELEIPLLDVLWGGSTEQLDQTAYSQPGLFAIEYALAVLWRSWGIEPAVVLGHSVGEYVAACVAGVYSLADGLKLIARRGRLMQAVAGNGAMAAVHAPEDRVREALRGLEQRVAIAAINGPESLVISGYEQELHIAEQRLMDTGVTVQRLNVSHAFHSPQMRAMEEAFEAAVREIRFQPPRLRLISSVTGRAVTRDEMSQAAYWRRQVSEPVRFGQAMETLRESGDAVFLEVGPGATLTGLGQQCIDTPQSLWLASLRRKREEWPQLLDTLAQLYARGADVNWVAFDQPYAPRRVPLPTYPFQRQRYWLEASSTPKTSLSTAQTAQQVKPTTDQVPSDWFYEIDWQPVKLESGSLTKPSAHRWMIVPNGNGIGSELCDRIAESGGQAVVASSEQDLAALLRGQTYDFVVYLAVPAHGDPAAGHSRQVAGALEVVKAVIAAQSGARLWVVTSAALPVLPDEAGLDLLQSPLWGLGRTVALEHPDCWGGLLDLDPSVTIRQSSAEIVSGIQNAHEEDQIAFRNAQVYGARLVRRLSPSGAIARFHPEKTYLITGGLGGLGLEVAIWMAGRGARNLALVSRRAPSEEAAAAIEKLRRDGVQVKTYAADVSFMPQMEMVFRDLGELGGVVHCAGVLDDGVVTQQTADRVERVMAPKITGAWNLHQLTAGQPLEFFVMFSSVSSLTGSSGQTGYAAANAFLDALACYRRSNGLTALSINWGGWAETGMAARSGLQKRNTPITLMRVDLALTAMGQAMLSDFAQICIADVDWDIYRTLYGTRPFLSQVGTSPEIGAPDKGVRPGERLYEQLFDAPESTRPGLIQDFVQVLAARILELPPGRRIDPQQALTELGLDSLMALELRNALASEFSLSLPATLSFNYPAVEDIAAFVHTRLFGVTESPKTEPVSGALSDLDSIEELSDEEIDSILARKLGGAQ
jgi:acyl transferase domain-containing protein/acyl carrier protein